MAQLDKEGFPFRFDRQGNTILDGEGEPLEVFELALPYVTLNGKGKYFLQHGMVENVKRL